MCRFLFVGFLRRIGGDIDIFVQNTGWLLFLLTKTFKIEKNMGKSKKSVCKIRTAVLYYLGILNRIQKCKITGENDHLKV